MPDLQSLIESVAGDNEQARNLFQGFYDQLILLNQATGNNFVNPVNNAQAASSQVPNQGQLIVTAANGVYTWSVKNAAQGGVNATIYNKISYSTVQNFGENVTVLPVSTQTSGTVQSPGGQLYFKLESSFNQTNYNQPVNATAANGTSAGAVSSGLQSSAAQANYTVLNQSNYMYVDSQASGSTAVVRVYGAAGPYNSGITVKGGAESQKPSATIINVPYGTEGFVAYDGEQYRVTAQLPGTFDDEWTPIGKVSVVGTGTPTLPAVTLYVQGGHVVGYDITNYGTGLTQLPTFTVTDSSGAGAQIAATGINAGAITGIQILNSGSGYSSSPTVTATGGVFSGATGGGTVTGGNGGRMTDV